VITLLLQLKAHAKGRPVNQHRMRLYSAHGVQLHAAIQAVLREPALRADEDDNGGRSFDGMCNCLKVLHAMSLLCCPKSLFTYSRTDTNSRTA